MKSAFALVTIVLLGCGTSPEIAPGERLDPLRPCFARAPLPAGAAHERIDELVTNSELLSPGRVSVVVRAYDVPRVTADTLGPLATAGGAEGRNAFLVAPLGPAALARIEALVAEEKARLVWADEAAGATGTWLTCRAESRRAEIAGIAWTTSATLKIGVERRATGLATRVAVIPAPERDAVVLAVRLYERMDLKAGSLSSRAFEDRTLVPVTIPATLERRAEDAFWLPSGAALALLGAAPDAGRVRLIVLAPSLCR